MVDRFRPLTRNILAKFLKDHESIKAFEKTIQAAGETLPDAIDASGVDAGAAIAQAASALAAVTRLAHDMMSFIAPHIPHVPDGFTERPIPSYAQPDSYYPPPRYIGTLGHQNRDRVDIIGGAISGVTVSAVTSPLGIRSSGAAFDLQIGSSEALTGNRLLSIVMNDDARTITLFGNTTVPVFSQQITFVGPTVARTVTLPDANFSVARKDATETLTGDRTITGAFGCNGAAAQTSYALGPAATDLASSIALVNNLRTMSINNGTGTS